jgi:G3E family GTPase
LFVNTYKHAISNIILTLSPGLKVAVIENEFGEVGIDDSLVKQRFDSKEEIFEMNNGCICCTVRGDLIRILNKILGRKCRMDAVLIETTGLADPAPVIQTFFLDENIKAKAKVDAILTVVDAKHILDHLSPSQPGDAACTIADQSFRGGSMSGTSRQGDNQAQQQVVFADKILLNKIDLVSDTHLAEVERRLRELNKLCEIVRCEHANVPLEHLLGIGAFDLDKIMMTDPDFLNDDTAHAHHHDRSISSVGILRRGNLNLDKMNSWMSSLLRERGQDIYRCKGVLCIEDMENKFVFQGVHMVFQGNEQDAWKAEEDRINKLIFIGKNLNRGELNASFEACLVNPTTEASGSWGSIEDRTDSARIIHTSRHQT